MCVLNENNQKYKENPNELYLHTHVLYKNTHSFHLCNLKHFHVITKYSVNPMRFMYFMYCKDVYKKCLSYIYTKQEIEKLNVWSCDSRKENTEHQDCKILVKHIAQVFISIIIVVVNIFLFYIHYLFAPMLTLHTPVQ